MEDTLKVTNVLADPTRFSIYNYIMSNRKEVTVQNIAKQFNIHPNVARLHLSKLEDVNMLVSETKKTGRGGRPSRIYQLSDQVIKLNFPYRNYELLATIALETLAALGDSGKEALMKIGKQYGQETSEGLVERGDNISNYSFDEKLALLEKSAVLGGFYPQVDMNEDNNLINLHIYNCPFKEVADQHKATICGMHKQFLNGLFSTLFDQVEISEQSNILDGCETCSYQAKIS